MSLRGPAVLVVAKAPVPGLAKTRLAASVGHRAAADLAAAALLDVLDAAAGAATALSGTLVVALTGDVATGARADDVTRSLARARVVPQRGEDFAARLAAAHADAAVDGRAVVQVGMDTPQATADDLVRAADALDDADAVLGPAPDGGWWLLGLRDADHAEALRAVPMSTGRTGRLTRDALHGSGCRRIVETAPLRDVDELEDARLVADAAPGTRFAAAWRALDLAGARS